MIKEVTSVMPIFKTFAGENCPIDSKHTTYLVSTFNEWKNYCKQCDKRFNDRLKWMPQIDEM